MKVKIEYVMLVIIIAVLSAFLFFRSKNNNTNYELPQIPKIVEKDISKIILHNAGNDILLVKENDKWFVNNEKFNANKDFVGSMIKEITGLNLTALVSESKNYTMYDLDESKKINVEALSGDKSLLKIDIGKTASSYRHTLVRLDKDDKVYQANGNFRNTFEKKVSDLRDKVVMHFEENATDIVLNDSKKEIKISKKAPVINASDTTKQKNLNSATAPAEWETDKKEKVKTNEIEAIINSVKNLTCENFVENKTKKDFEKFIYKVEVKGNKMYSIAFVEKTDDKYIAISSENDYPFYLPEWSAKNIMKELDNIVDREKKK
ncbi:DUF4340 domain-containing protein [Candidatus Poribacteria bacterium]|nr:DUF4340 domain-containing protein [Candidatus Poribacteria bacterium]